MDYIYAAITSDGIVKVGRSTDVWTRLYALDSESKRYGVSVDYCLISTVFDSVRVERELLDVFRGSMDSVSRESFKFDEYEDIFHAFNLARVPFLLCEMSSDKFGPVLAKDSFSPTTDNMAKGRLKDVLSQSERIERRIIKVAETYSGKYTNAIIKNRTSYYDFKVVMNIVDDMVKRGALIRHEEVKGGRALQWYTLP